MSQSHVKHWNIKILKTVIETSVDLPRTLGISQKRGRGNE